MGSTLKRVNYWLSEHPIIVGFRWSPLQSWGSTWSFLFNSIVAYVAAAVVLHVVLLLIRGRRPVPLGPIPALHSLAMSVVYAAIFAGLLSSACAEIRDTRWFWRRTKTPIQWLLCFPLGTRSSGRVFFWSYAFYLSRFLHMLRTFLAVLRLRELSLLQLLHHSILICMSFLWLEFSQSFQVLAILSTTLVYTVIYGYRFLTAVGLPSVTFPFVANCQIFLLTCNLVCHFGVLVLHFFNGGCNGIGAWVFNSVLNGTVLLLFLKFYVKETRLSKRNVVASVTEGTRKSSSATTNELVGGKNKES